MTNDTLKPCPFCGGEAEALTFSDLPFDCGCIARCKCCGVVMRESSNSLTRSSLEEAKQKVIERWNRRAYETEIADLKRGIIRNPENAYVMGFPMLNLLVLADALYKKGVSVEQVDDFITEVGNAYEYCFKEQERIVFEAIRRSMNIDEFEVKV